MREKGKPIWSTRAFFSKENKRGVEIGETSFRVYYGEKGAAVPFMWESQPGTPKHPMMFNSLNDQIIPPLTPPPSYHTSSSSSSGMTSSSSRKNRSSRILLVFLNPIFGRSCSISNSTRALTSSSAYSSPLSWSRSTSNSSFLSLTSSRDGERSIKHKTHGRSLSTPRAKNNFFFFDDDDDEGEVSSSPTSSTIMCFGFKKRGCQSMKGMKHSFVR